MSKQKRNAATTVAAQSIHPQLPACKDSQRKETVKREGGDGVDEVSPEPSGNNKCHKEVPERGSQGIKINLQTPFLNLDPFHQCYGVENVARVRINGESCMALLNNGAQINTITLKYVSKYSLQVRPITNLICAKVARVGLGNAYTKPLGYVIIWVQVDGVQGYDEDQIDLVILDLSNFVAWIPVILGTPAIS